MARKKITEQIKPFSQCKPEIVQNPSIAHMQESQASYYDSFNSNEYGSISPTLDYSKYNNLINRSYPLQRKGSYTYIRQAIILCQTAWIYIPVFYQTIETMTVLANTGVQWIGGSKDGKNFFQAWWNRINGFNLTEQSFRELTLSSNLILQRLDGGITKNKLNKFILSSQADESVAGRTIKIPVKYVVINPADICINELDQYAGKIIPTYYRFIDVSTIQALKKLDENDGIELSKTIRDLLENGGTSVEALDPNNTHIIFYKKQDYFPFAIPMGFSVLEDINLKLELKKADACVAKTVESIITLVKHGATDKDGNTVMNPLVDEALKSIFKGSQKSKTVVADCTTTVEFAIPDIKKVIGDEKYDKLDLDINDGLFNIFFGEQKFANIAVKLRVFLKLLENLQNTFLTQFLYNEVKRVGKLVGYSDKEIPVPKFNKIDVDDPVQMARIYAQFAQLGLLTADETFNALQTGLLPTKEDSVEHQEEYKKFREKDLYYPLVGGSKEDEAVAPGGRPKGTKSPQKKKKISPKGASLLESYLFDVQKFREYTLLSNQITNEITEKYKNKTSKKKLTSRDKEFISSVATHIVTNEPPEKWEESISIYIEQIPAPNFERVGLVYEIQNENKVDEFAAAVLSHCIINRETEI